MTFMYRRNRCSLPTTPLTGEEETKRAELEPKKIKTKPIKLVFLRDVSRPTEALAPKWERGLDLSKLEPHYTSMASWQDDGALE